MIVGVPKEIKPDENRVAVTPEGARELIAAGVTLLVQSGAGAGSGFDDSAYETAGANLIESAETLFEKADLIVKVKEPIAQEYPLFKKGQILFTYLHLAADRALTEFLLEKEITAFAYETLEVNGKLPLLEPMSEVAGKMAPIMGTLHLGRYQGGEGILPGGVAGTERAKVMILGGGVAGKAAAQIAAGLGADVTVFDINLDRLRYLEDVMPKNVATRYSSAGAIAQLLPDADMVIGTVLIPGAKAPKLITREMLSDMKEGSVLVDVSIDQGGCFESSRPTTHSSPTYIEEGVVHYSVANMPGAYPRTSTYALTNATLPYIKALAIYGPDKVLEKVPAMRGALNTRNGELTNQAVADAFGLEAVH
ncbi:MAG TPA: alanine dehydrogenase [Campylobacteraceae bacterium]|nr:alanine dehydrogenase [Campylobacteraceae bacterium]